MKVTLSKKLKPILKSKPEFLFLSEDKIFVGNVPRIFEEIAWKRCAM